MNRKQLYILLIGAAVMIVSELFPAWVYEDENTSVRRSAGYHFRFAPPKLQPPDQMRKIFGLSRTDPTKFMWVHIDGICQLEQRVAIPLLTIGGILVSFNRRILAIYVFGWLFLCAGVGIVALLVFHRFILLS
jgi:hypothetical protein